MTTVTLDETLAAETFEPATAVPVLPSITCVNMLGFSERTLRYHQKRGTLPVAAIRIGARLVTCYRWTDIETLFYSGGMDSEAVDLLTAACRQSLYALGDEGIWYRVLDSGFVSGQQLEEIHQRRRRKAGEAV